MRSVSKSWSAVPPMMTLVEAQVAARAALPSWPLITSLPMVFRSCGAMATSRTPTRKASTTSAFAMVILVSPLWQVVLATLFLNAITMMRS